MLKGFKEFALKGSFVDMGVGIVVGVAFGAIVNSFVKDLITPPFGMLLGNVDFSDLFINFSGTHYASLAEAKDAGVAVIAYGAFASTLINFLFIALVLFFFIRWINKLREKLGVAVRKPRVKKCPYCLSSIPFKATRCPQCTSQLEVAQKR